MRNFDEIVAETVYEIIDNVFENETAELILQFYNENSATNLEERTRIFSNDLSKILGDGFTIVQDLIIETLYFKLGLDLKWKEGYDFSDYLVELRNHPQLRDYK